MKTVFILSDTHGNTACIQKIFPIMKESDYVIHLGDCTCDMRMFRKELGDKLITVSGNCDFFKSDDEKLIEIEGCKVFCCHGHRYGVKSGLERLKARADELNADVALYGHTHEAEINKEEKILLINPGNMTICSINKSYCYLVINNGKCVAKTVKII